MRAHTHTHTHTHTTSDLPPSQGGRYGGFGNTVEPTKKQESEFLSDTWSSITSVSDLKLGGEEEGGERKRREGRREEREEVNHQEEGREGVL